MNLFWKKLLGGITPTEKLEKQEADLIIAMKRYEEVDKSVELAEYKALYHVVNAGEFRENKKILQNRKYKDTEEYQVTKKFHKLRYSPAIQLYYKVLESEDLKHYLAFKATPEFEQLGDKKLVSASPALTKLKRFERSKEFRTYTRFHNSFTIKEFEELKVKVSSPEFKKTNEFWSNAKRWQLTPECEKEDRFHVLAKNPDIVFYINEKPERFEKHRKLKATFSDEFDWHTLNNSHWNFGFHYKSSQLIGNHSFANEKQANNDGKNVVVENGILKIATKHEKATTKAWHPTKGFIEKEFQYTSDVFQTAEKFRQKNGVIRAKIRCHGNINHAFWLGAENKLPHVNIFHFNGKQISVGNTNKNLVDGIKISGLNPSEYYIYTLVWTNKEMYWMINDLEVYRTASNIPSEEMYLAFNSFISEKQHGSAGHMEVDWVRTYSFN